MAFCDARSDDKLQIYIYIAILVVGLTVMWAYMKISSLIYQPVVFSSNNFEDN